jgi:hypothetical protein
VGNDRFSLNKLALDRPEMDGDVLPKLFKALQDDDIRVLETLVPASLRAYMCLDLRDLAHDEIFHDQPPLLSIAIFYNAMKCAKYLLDNGADIGGTDNVLLLFSMAFFFSFFVNQFIFSRHLYQMNPALHFLYPMVQTLMLKMSYFALYSSTNSTSLPCKEQSAQYTEERAVIAISYSQTGLREQ